jgi:RND superfamily putative drug exporter
MLSHAFSQLAKSGTWSRDHAEVGIVMPTDAGLEIFLCGGVTVALDDGTGVTLIEGRNRCLYQSVRTPGVAAVVTVDELGKRPALTPPSRNAVFSMPDGVVPGRGAVVWTKDAAAAPLPAARWVVLDDDSRLAIDRDCVIGRDPSDSTAVRQGLRPVCIYDRSGLMSRAHMEIRIIDGELVVVDRASTNGVLIREPGEQVWKRIAPWRPAVFREGASIQVGGRTMRLQPHSVPHQQQHEGARLHAMAV